MKKKSVILACGLILFLTSVVIAGAILAWPPIPRTKTAMNRAPSNPLVDTITVGCSGIFDVYRLFQATGSTAATCPNFNVQSKIRWDWASGGRVACAMSGQQTDGDKRVIIKRVIVFGCDVVGAVVSDTVVERTPCQTTNYQDDAAFASALGWQNTQTDCNAAAWSFVNQQCILDEIACNNFAGYWYFTNSTCGLSQPQCSGIGWYWNTFSPECSETSAPCPEQQYECFGAQNWSEWGCQCTDQIPSPIVVDVLGNGFNLTSAASGVNFDVDGDGTAEHVSWTAAGSDDAFLVYDRDNNGLIERGVELFGNYTPQSNPPVGEEKNGFLALGEYDKPANGGNNNGEIDQGDRVFSSLRLWQDLNHNGISEPNELYALTTFGLSSVELSYKESKKRDVYGNQFRFRSKVKDIQGHHLGRWAWDVFLIRSS